MSDPFPSPDFEEKMRKALSTPPPRQAFIWQQRARLISQADRIKVKPSVKLKLLVRFSLAVMLLFLAVVVITTTDLAKSMEKLLGNIPGLGIRERSSQRLLTDPVVTERQGITLTVSKVTADQESTILLIEVEGFTRSNTENGGGTDVCQSSPRLHLLDDTLLEAIDGEGYGWETGYTQLLTYQALPQDLNDFILEIPCLTQVATDQEPQSWIIPLHLVNADPEQVVQVIQIPPTPTPNAATSAPSEGEEAEAVDDGPTMPFYNATFSLDDVVDLGDGYIFVCSTRWADEKIIYFGMTPLVVLITDAEGNEIPYEEVTPNRVAEAAEKLTYSAYQVSGSLFAWPLTITVSSLQVDLSANTPFSFDTSDNMMPGLAWQLGLELPVEAYTLQVLAAEMVREQDEYGAVRSGFKISMQSADGIVGASVIDPVNPYTDGGRGNGVEDTQEFTSTVLYDTMPERPFNLVVSEISIQEDGNWQVSWSP